MVIRQNFCFFYFQKATTQKTIPSAADTISKRKDFAMKKIGSSLCCMAFLIAFLVSASAVRAQKLVTVFTDGC